jgi:hypothetical protein
MLAQRAVTNSVIGNGGTWSDPHGNPPTNIATSCHFATIYWVFWDEFGRAPTQNDIVTIGNAQTAVGRMLPHGSRKTNPLQGALTLTAGSILVFVQNNTAEHSCVAITHQTLGGYNQMGWYSAGGGNHTYSTHPTNQLMWGTLNHRSQVHRVQAPGWYDLFEVPEGAAKAIVRGFIQP